MSRRDDIRARWEAATPGPWEATENGLAAQSVAAHPGIHVEVYADTSDAIVSNAQAIAHAPADVAYLDGLDERLEAVASEYATWGSCLCDPGHRMRCGPCEAVRRLDAYRAEHGE